MIPDDVLEKEMKRMDPYELHFRFEVAASGHMLSWFSAGAASPGSPGYESNKHLLWADWSVRRDHRRQGIGRSWVPLVLEIMDRHSYTTLEVYDGRLPESMWDDYAPQLSSLLNTMPFDDLDHGEIAVTPATIADRYERHDMSGRISHLMLTREPGGVISGITEMVYAADSPAIVYQGFTGVRPDARGRGLGKWLKAAMAVHMRELYPSAAWSSTDNATSNAPMLAINTKIGYKRHRVSSEYQITRDRLGARLRELTPTTPG